jgi:sec-independent protein translocase protein TatB
MLDLGWTELLLIGIVALIVVGPKDLPGMFRAVGNFVGRAKRMAREFSQAMNDAADDAGVGDVKRTLNAASPPMKSAMDEVKKSTEDFTAKTMAGPAKKEPDAKRKEQIEKIRAKTQEVGEERLAREKAEREAAQAKEASAKEADKPAASKPAAKKPAAKKPTTKTSAPKSGATKSGGAKKPAAKKTPAKASQAKSAEDNA